MSTHAPKELLGLWTREKITVEMAIGHILQNLVNMHTAIEIADASLYKLRADVDGLMAHTGMSRLKDGKRPLKCV